MSSGRYKTYVNGSRGLVDLDIKAVNCRADSDKKGGLMGSPKGPHRTPPTPSAEVSSWLRNLNIFPLRLLTYIVDYIRIFSRFFYGQLTILLDDPALTSAHYNVNKRRRLKALFIPSVNIECRKEEFVCILQKEEEK